MMDSLYIAQTGLKTSRYGVDVTSNNIANEDTKGYKKRVIQTSELNSLENNIGNGVSFDGVIRTTSQYLYSQILNQNSYSTYYTQQNSTLSSAEMIFKETATSGFSVTLNNFFTAVESLRGEPTSSTYQAEVDTQAQMVITGIKGVYADLEELQDDNLSLLKDQVDEVNSILEQIVHLNRKMVETGETNDLLDKRDALESQLSDYGDIDVSTANGNYTLKIGGENVIFNTSSFHKLSINEEYIQQKDIYTTTELEDSNVSDGDTITISLNNTTTLTLSANVSGLPENELKQQIVDAINSNPAFNSVEAYLDSSNNLVIKGVEGGEDNAFDIKITVNNATLEKDAISQESLDHVSVAVYNNELNLSGGSMKSLSENLTSETSEILSYKRALNDFVKAFVEAYSKDNSTTLFTGTSVNTLSYVKNSTFSLTAGDLEAISQVQWNDNLSIGNDSSVSLDEFYKKLLVRVSTDVEDNSFNSESQDAVLNSMLTTYENLTKVDPDSEMISLMQYQAAYEANAKVITAVDEMLQTILNM
ncbi:flagellar hook-associated protein FlgK [Halarcobacter ebronensis]|uniref:Flagellar hook-associated protein 1 n=1 Tax=Halarcobacter ebronensis TaxID=1462615 RepID=A0A4Q1ANU2_9BACT|nr:flagellar basal body rod C-terminal domain-containing protein [Halarcobacter ebronensis]QKF82081.1 proximal flagellar hook-filament junction protein FlgK [Halarcobacter ebronensis]RXK04144.1 hypothetical protein CRV07_11715 [Halarcobacter ebronensis]